MSAPPVNHIEAARALCLAGLVEAATARARSAERDHATAAAAVEAAENGLEIARRQPERLWQRATEKCVISDAEIDELGIAERRAERRLEFRRLVADHFRGKLLQAEKDLNIARRAAWAPVLQCAIDLQIRAAAQADAARRAGPRQPDIGPAGAVWESACEILALVVEHSDLLTGFEPPDFGQPAQAVKLSWRRYRAVRAA